ncbi:MAG: hypothetical protein NTZ05_14820 [Chloroflexi bacterium]|nr:hypothetical protein [Chloroflexota bacterium]
MAQLAIYGPAIVIALTWQVGPLLEFFRPVSPTAATSVPELRELLEPASIPAGQLANLMRSVLAGAALFWVYANVLQAQAEASAGTRQEPAAKTSGRGGAAPLTVKEGGRREAG